MRRGLILKCREIVTRINLKGWVCCVIPSGWWAIHSDLEILWELNATMNFMKVWLYDIIHNPCKPFVWQYQAIWTSSRLARGHPTPKYCCIPFKLTVTHHTPLYRHRNLARITHHAAVCRTSRGRKIGCKTQKSQKFRFDIENFTDVTPNFDCCRNVELVFWVTHHNHCRFERNTTVAWNLRLSTMKYFTGFSLSLILHELAQIV
jgi:hypothetical protein